MKTIISLSLLFVLTSIQAQDSSLSNTNQIYFKWPNWKMNGHRLKPKELRQELMKVDEAMLYYKKAETNMTFTYLSFIPGMTFMYLGKRSKTYPYNHKYGFSIAGIICLGTSTYFASRYKKNMKKAVRIYNQKY